MKKRRFRLRESYYLVIWSVILLAAIYLLVRFAEVSFSEDMGQAKKGLKERIISDLYVNAMNSGSSLLQYNAKGKNKVAFPASMLTDTFAITRFTKDKTEETEVAKETLSLNQNTSVKALKKSIKKKNSSALKWKAFHFTDVTKGTLSKNYILTNGASINSFLSDMFTAKDGQKEENTDNKLTVGCLKGDLYLENDEDMEADDSSSEAMHTNTGTKFTMEQLSDVSFLVRNFYIVDKSTKVTDNLFNAKELLGKDMTMKQNKDEPQILIYHTHAHEAYADSREGNEEDTVVGVGSRLTEILENTYGYNVIHDKTPYDMVNGKLDRNLAYNKALPGIKKILDKYPSIEVVIDLHRDGSAKRVTTIDGKEVARVMLFNGLSRDQNGPITYLDNPNLQDNLAFSLQLQMKSLELYPGFFYKNYLKWLRYNLHVRPKSLLVELGTDKNTVEQAKNAMKPFAEVLDSVLKGK